MTIAKQIIIDDQKKTIHRLQDECTEKTNAIIALGEQLKRKEQECKKLRFPMKDTNYAILTKEEFEEYDQLKAENEKMSKGYEELTEIVSPYINDFTGYNEELQSFDIVLCVKELMQQLDALETENEHLSEKEEEARHYLKEAKKFKNCLTEIKEVAEKVLKECNNCEQYSCSGCPDENKEELAQQILQKYKEVLYANDKEKKDLQMQFCPICGESFLTPKGAELYDENEKLKQTLQEIKGIVFELMKADK